MKIFDCPFCSVDDLPNGSSIESGCCFCDHSGKIKIGHIDSFFQTEEDYNAMVESTRAVRRQQYQSAIDIIHKMRQGTNVGNQK